MRALCLDYQQELRAFPALGVAVLGAAVLALVLMGSRYRELDQRIVELESRVHLRAQLSQRQARVLRPATEQAAREQALEVQHANTTLRQLSLPWSALFRAVETAGGKSVALLSMQPDMQKGTVTLDGEAKDFPAVLDYVRRLGSREVFTRVHLHTHQIQQQDPERPVRFSVLAVWKVEGT